MTEKEPPKEQHLPAANVPEIESLLQDLRLSKTIKQKIDPFIAAHNGDYKSLLAIDKDKLARMVNDKGRTILHIAAINHNLDFLFACICLGIDQTIVDCYNKTFVDYLTLTDYFHIKQLKIIWKIEKIKINVYLKSAPKNFTEFDPHIFILKNVTVKDRTAESIQFGYAEPIITTIWETDPENMDPESIPKLERALEQAIDLDLDFFKTVKPPEKFACLLAEYGWFPNYPVSPAVLAAHKTFYNPALWKSEAIIRGSFKAMSVSKIPPTILGVTIVCISDVHFEYKRLHIPGGDILVCAGDSAIPKINDLTEYIHWFASHNHTYKILISGNHDKIIQTNKWYYLDLFKRKGIIYLEDSSVTIGNLVFYGTPWTVKRPKNKNNAFTLSRRELMKKWDLIPENVNVLISHSPPFGIGDMNSEYYRGVPYQCGDPGLRKTINRLPNLKVHIFGHQHFGKGIYEAILPEAKVESERSQTVLPEAKVESERSHQQTKRSVYFVNCALPQDPFPTTL